MTSRTDIANRALVKVGTQRLAALTDPSEQARVISTVFGSLAQEELRKHAWSFSIKRATLPQLNAAPINSFLISYQLPSDCLRLVHFNDQWADYGMGVAITDAEPPYRIEGTTLLSRETTAKIRYVSDLSEDTTKWDAAFVGAFACRLAHEIAPSLTKDKQKVRDLAQDYRAAIVEARRCNAIELPPNEVPDGSWVLSRLV